MVETIERFGTERGLKMLGDWTDRIAKGELPASKPPRPQGLERNVVITVWDWSGPKTYLHDEIATDKRNPTINAYGSLYGATENSTDNVPILDPVKNTATTREDPGARSRRRPRRSPPRCSRRRPIGATRRSGPPDHPAQPDVRREGAGLVRGPHSRRRTIPTTARRDRTIHRRSCSRSTKSNREIAMLDPQTQKFTLIDTCFPTHHVQFGFDEDRTLWTSSGGIGAEVLGWINTKVLEETGDEAKAQGWTAFILDTNGNGKRDEGYVEPNQPVDPTKDKRIRVGFYVDRAESRPTARSGAR